MVDTKRRWCIDFAAAKPVNIHIIKEFQMLCFGISNSAPEVILDLLVQKGIARSRSSVAVVASGSTLDPELKPKRPIVFVLNTSDLMHNLRVLNSDLYLGTRVFIFASPLRLRELQGCTVLDMVEDVANRGLAFKLLNTPNMTPVKSPRAQDAEVKRQKTQYLTALVDNVRRGSLMTPLMTFIYTLPRATQQTPVKEAVAKHLYNGTRVELVVKNLSALLSEKNCEKLVEILESEAAAKYRTAFQALRDKTVASLKTACTRYDVTDYEMQYLMSVVGVSKANVALRGKSLKTIQAKGLTPASPRSKKKVKNV